MLCFKSMNGFERGARSKHIGEDFLPARYRFPKGGNANAERILKTHGEDYEIGLTSIDLPSIPVSHKMGNEEFNELKTPLWMQHLYAQFPRSEEMTEEQYLLKIKESAENAMYFLRNILDIPRILVPAPTSIDRERRDWLAYIKSIKSLEDLSEIYQSLQLINEKQGRKNKMSQDSLIKHVALCAFAKTTAVMFTLNDGRIEMREKAFAFFEKALKGDVEGIEPLFKEPQSGESGVVCNRVLVPKLNIQASYCSRLKSIYSSAMKLILIRNADIQQALKDAVGIRVELAQQDILEFVNHIIEYFASQRKSFAIENFDDKSFLKLDVKGNLLSSEDVENLQDKFPYLDINFDRENDKSSSKYRDIKLRFVISYQNTPVNIEIQILHKGHRNESGFSNHILYDLKKRVLVMQRLYGVVPNKWLGHAIGKVSEATKLSADKIWDTFFSSSVVRRVNKRLVAPSFYQEKPLQK